MLSHSPSSACSLNQPNVIYLCFLSVRWERSTFHNFEQIWQVSSAFFRYERVWVSYQGDCADWTCVLKYQMSSELLSGCMVETSISCSPSIKRHSQAEADTAVVSYWYLCCSSWRNCSRMQPQPSAAVSSLHILSDCLKDSSLIVPHHTVKVTWAVDIWSSAQKCQLTSR